MRLLINEQGFFISLHAVTGIAVALPDSLRPLILETRHLSHLYPRGICSGQSVNGTGFLRVLQFTSVTNIPPKLLIQSFNYHRRYTILTISINKEHIYANVASLRVSRRGG